MEKRKILIIVNSIARAYKEFLADEKRVIKLAADNYVAIEIYKTKKAGDASLRTAEAVNEGFSLIIAAGGDGTIFEIINALGDHDIPIGIIPIGTSNVFASEMNIPKDVYLSFSLLLHNSPIKVDLGRVNDKKFIFTAGCGLDSFTINNLDFRFKTIFGRPSFVLTGIKSFFQYKFPKITLNFPDENIIEAGYQVMINNTKSYGGNYMLAPKASVFDGLLDVIILKRRDVFSNIRYLLSVPFEEHLKYRDISYYQTKKVILKAEQPVNIQLDSEVCAVTPAEVEVIPRGLSVILP